ncbi:MAG: hypothetical protein Q9212_006152 [Teloschistes hypoglaucus]
MAAVIFLLTPDLEILDITQPCWNSHWLRHLMKRAVDSIPAPEGQLLPFQKLRIIGCTPGNLADVPMVDLLCDYVQLSSVQEICVHNCQRHDTFMRGDGERIPVEFRSSTMERLQIRDCHLSSSQLNTVLRACGRLKTFVYEFSWMYMEDTPAVVQNTTKALVRMRASLENLWLDFQDDLSECDTFAIVPGHMPLLSPLRELKNLKNLKIGLWAVFESTDKEISRVPGTADAESELPDLRTILPVSLENIYFGRTRNRLWLIVLALAKLLRSKASFVPNLKVVSIEFFEIDMDDKAPWWSDLADLENLAASVSVKVRRMIVRKNELESRTRPTRPGFASCGQGVDGCLTWAKPYTIESIDSTEYSTLELKAVSLVDG